MTFKLPDNKGRTMSSGHVGGNPDAHARQPSGKSIGAGPEVQSGKGHFGNPGRRMSLGAPDGIGGAGSRHPRGYGNSNMQRRPGTFSWTPCQVGKKD